MVASRSSERTSWGALLIARKNNGETAGSLAGGGYFSHSSTERLCNAQQNVVMNQSQQWIILSLLAC